MRVLTALVAVAFLGIGSVSAQTTHVITVQNFSFAPGTLTIEVGDTVEWRNEQGLHNVAETTSGTPAGFGNGGPAPSPWTYSFTFTTVGDFTYQCDQHPSMQGTISVQSTTAVEDELPAGLTLGTAYPNPFETTTSFSLTTDQTQTVRVTIFDATGREVDVLLNEVMTANSPRRIEWTPSDAPTGVYFFRIEGETFQVSRKVVYIQ